MLGPGIANAAPPIFCYIYTAKRCSSPLHDGKILFAEPLFKCEDVGAHACAVPGLRKAASPSGDKEVCHLFVIAGKHVSCDDAKNGNLSGGNISPFVHIKTVQVQGKWVSKGRLKFSRTYRKITKRFNIRYPFAQKVLLVDMCSVLVYVIRRYVYCFCVTAIRNETTSRRLR